MPTRRTIVIGLAVTAVLAGGGLFLSGRFGWTSVYSGTPLALLPLREKPLTLAFTGDIMLDRGVRHTVEKYGGGDYRFPFLEAAKTLSSYDFLFGNLEGPLSDKGTDLGSEYSFRMDPAALSGLTYAGFDALSVANNHAGDWGRAALSDTLARLEEAGIIPVGGGADGEQAYAPRFVTLGSTRVALVGASQFGKGYLETGSTTPGIALADSPRFLESIRNAATEADIVVASLHFGEEYSEEPTEYQKRIAENAIDAGADLVVGHHPHVVLPLERYGDGWIAYSLGNFVFDQNFSKRTTHGALLEITVEHKKITAARLRETTISPHFEVSIGE